MSTICSAALLGSLIDLDMLDDEIAGVESFGIGIRFSIFQERKKVFGRFDWPSGTSDTKCLSYIKSAAWSWEVLKGKLGSYLELPDLFRQQIFSSEQPPYVR